jgi:RNA polymerase sigma-70 factor (ECF subfamily)
MQRIRRVGILQRVGRVELLEKHGCLNLLSTSFSAVYNAGMSPSHFATTHWSLVLAARDRAEPGADDALASLCTLYWYPLYAYVRRRGHSADEAHDLTQEFFARLLEKDFLAAVDRSKGKFRSFLLAACNHFLANERDRARAKKRGGGRPLLSLDSADAEGRYRAEPAENLTPEKLFERRWALALLQQVMTRLRDEFEAKGKGRLFDHLRGFLVGEKGVGYHRAGRELGLSEGAVKVAVHRLRQRYRELLHEEIGRTVEGPDQVEEEVRELFAALGS